MVQGNFTRDIKDTYYKNSLEGCFGKLNLIHIGRSEKEIRKNCQFALADEMFSSSSFVLGYQIMVSRTLIWLEKTEKFS